ncbi:TetR/AcrR family transcriptional regulator [Cryptosporangium aurantiacum]|uniref:Transcriptional regulator, TetR family n=1 Tax=Cryptosporangium aurantiacum TaxID=134849 RepID=A0A1M7RB42_9ACTN|nr:TetR/AcrR family transcriptional regulator [Cryptosporangium aurantiacum]SHN43390.1 transcriptional regulator, TetR family [Cryptosporangium aurantiacum]
MGSGRTYGGVAGTERAAERRAQLLEAGLDLLGAPDGPGEVTVRGVCRAAGLTARYFYESFADRDALMVAVYDHVVAELGAEMLAAVEASPHAAAPRTRAGLAVLVRSIAEDPRRGRLLFSRSVGASPVVAARRAESTRWFVDLMAAQVREFYRIERTPRVDVAAELLVGGVAQILTSWLDGVLLLTADELVDHCAELFLAVAGERTGA